MKIMLVAIFVLQFLSIIHAEDIKFENVRRNIYLNSHKIVAKFEISVKNYAKSIQNGLEIIFNHHICSKIYFLSAKQGHLTANVTKRQSNESSKYCYFKLNFPKKMHSGEECDISLDIIFGRRFIAHPAEAAQYEDHSFLFYDDFYMDSIYHVNRQETVFHVKRSDVLSVTSDPFVKSSDSRITIGPLLDSPPFSHKKFYLVHKYSQHIVIIDKLVSSYQISEWGIITAWHDFWIHNEAAHLKGEYSQVTKQHEDTHALNGWEMVVPANSYNMYYRDGLGNISTSSVKPRGNNKLLLLQPRFPLFGGWKTYYYVSYILSPLGFLFKDKSNPQQRKFIFELLGSPMKDFLIDDGTVKVLLPEGSIYMGLKYHGVNFDSIGVSESHSYLDFYGRPTIEFKLSHGCSEKNIEIEISYLFNEKDLLGKPIIVSLTIFVIMISTYFVVSMKIPVLNTKSTQIADICEINLEEIKKRAKIIKENCDCYMLAIRNFKIDKNHNRLGNALLKISPQLDKEMLEISVSLKDRKEMDPKCSNHVDDFLLKNKERLELINEYKECSKKVVTGEMDRKEYAKICSPLEDKVQQNNETIDKILNTL
ncbi:hypothetical protein MXB_2466 [Myxobolus squamalis]|nr:hypothetical protein MXB_2466 [Myxobolus squamalis]